MTIGQTVYPNISINENSVQTEKGEWNKIKKEFEAQDKWEIRKDISIPIESPSPEKQDIRGMKESTGAVMKLLQTEIL